jgi:hypothetical protein
MGFGATCFDTREVQQRIDEFEKPQTVSMGDFNTRPLKRTQRGRRPVVESVLYWTEHQRKRRTEFVAHVREKRRLCAIQFGEHFSAAPLLFIGLRIRNCGRDLACDQAEEAAIAFVNKPERIEPGNQHARASPFSRRRNRNQGGMFGRPVPGSRRKSSWNDLVQVDNDFELAPAQNIIVRPQCLGVPLQGFRHSRMSTLDSS